MPDAPTYGDLKVRMADQPAPQINPGIITPDLMGASIAQGVTHIATAIERVRADEQEKADNAAVFDATNRLTAKRNALLYDPQTGALNQRGVNAFSAPEEVRKGYDEGISEISATLTTPEQRLKFQQIAEHQRGDIDASVMRHVSSEREQYYQSTYDSTVANSVQDAANHATDPARIQEELQKQRGARDLQAHALGSNPESLRRAYENDTSATHAAVINSLLNQQDYPAAKSYYDAHATELLQDARDRLGKDVLAGDVRGQAQAAAGMIFNPDKSLEDMFSEADKITDQRVQAATKDRLQTQHLLHKQSIEEEGRKLYSAGLKTLNTDPRGLDAVPVQTLNRLNEIDPERYQALQAIDQRRLKREDVTTDQGNALFLRWRSALSGALGEEARNAALNEDETKNAAVWSRADLREIADLKDKARNGKDLSSEHTEEDVAAQTLALNGYKPDPLNHDKTANVEAIAFRNALRKQLAVDRAAGKKPTREDIQRTANKLMAPVPAGVGFFGGTITVPAFMLGVDKSKPDTVLGGGSPAYALTLADFSDEQVQATKATLRSVGAATDDNSVLRYLRAKGTNATMPAASPRTTAAGGDAPMTSNDYWIGN